MLMLNGNHCVKHFVVMSDFLLDLKIIPVFGMRMCIIVDFIISYKCCQC